MPLYEWLINKRLRYQYLTLLAFSILALLALYLLYRNTPKVSVNFLYFIIKTYEAISSPVLFPWAHFY